ncbi:gluconokinase [Roseateles sp. SL47]|uniref:gluconokinase n=1 Tax=Roseateles sp. SL47 TaxID=2995138 RepID=UPI002D1E3C3D|nr:gluconokinase [Roseateles sp. SL47]
MAEEETSLAPAASIVVMGVAGCGKTSVGAALARSLRWPFIEGDAHHSPSSIAKMQAGQALTDEDRWGWLDRLGALLQAPGPVVLSCSALKRAYRDRLRTAHPPLQFVYIDISRDLALARVTARAAGHIFPASLVESQFATLESPVGEAGVMTVSAELALEDQLQSILAQRLAQPVQRPDAATGATDAAAAAAAASSSALPHSSSPETGP